MSDPEAPSPMFRLLAFGILILLSAKASDARVICYLSPLDGHWQLILRNLDGTGRRILTSSPFDKKDPVFHPDGRRVFYSGTNHGVYWIDLATGSETRVGQALPGTRGIKFSDRGDKVLFYRARADANDQSEIWMADSSFHNPVQVIARPGLQRYPDGNGDFTTLIYLSGRSATGHDIWLFRHDGEKHTRLTHDKTTEGPPVLSPSGRWAAFPSAPLGTYSLYLTETEDPNPQPVMQTDNTILDIAWIDEENLICTYMAAKAEPQLATFNVKEKSFVKPSWEEVRGVRSPAVRNP